MDGKEKNLCDIHSSSSWNSLSSMDTWEGDPRPLNFKSGNTIKLSATWIFVVFFFKERKTENTFDAKQFCKDNGLFGIWLWWIIMRAKQFSRLAAATGGQTKCYNLLFVCSLIINKITKGSKLTFKMNHPPIANLDTWHSIVTDQRGDFLQVFGKLSDRFMGCSCFTLLGLEHVQDRL